MSNDLYTSIIIQKLILSSFLTATETADASLFIEWIPMQTFKKLKVGFIPAVAFQTFDNVVKSFHAAIGSTGGEIQFAIVGNEAHCFCEIIEPNGNKQKLFDIKIKGL